VTKLASATRRAAAKRIEFLLSTFLIVGAEISTALFMLFIGMSLSFAVLSVLSHVVESTCDPLTLTAAV
jgi:hypothetical protein